MSYAPIHSKNKFIAKIPYDLIYVLTNNETNINTIYTN